MARHRMGCARLLALAGAILLVPLTAALGPAAQLPAASAAVRAETGAAVLPDTESGAAPGGSGGVFTGAPRQFRILNTATGRVEVVGARDYVRGAVAAEMPALYHPEALKAQAVAAYTYAVRQALAQRAAPDPALKGADFEADPQNARRWLSEQKARELYGDRFDLYWSRVCTAADQAGQYILLYRGQPAATAYHAISAGSTEDARYVWPGGGQPYLTAVESPGDLLAAGYQSTAVFPAARLRSILEAALPGLALPADPAGWLAVKERSPSGYVTRAAVGDQEVTGLRLRGLLGLRSSHFQVREAGGVFTFAVQGYGHGVGLSQNGADYMARQGAAFDQILLHYYPGTVLALSSAGG